MQAALNDCRVSVSWTKIDDPHTIETWITSAPAADYRIELVERPRVGLELTAFKDVRSSAGFIRARRERPRRSPRPGTACFTVGLSRSWRAGASRSPLHLPPTYLRALAAAGGGLCFHGKALISRAFEDGRSWIRTRDLRLIRAAL
jgi:hypothetical protein